MTITARRLLVIAILLLILQRGSTTAQDFFDDLGDFGPVPEAEDAPARAGRLDPPAAAASDTAPAQPAASPAELAAVIEAIRAAEPTSADELLRAVDQLIRLEQPAIAKPYLERLVAMDLDVVALARLHQQFGTATFLRMAREAELAPFAGEFSTAVLQAMQSVLRDPNRLRTWAEQLGADDKRTQYQAAEQLLRAGPHAVAPVLRAMIDAGDNDVLRRNGLSILRGLGDAALGPVLAMLDSDDARTRATALTALGVLGAPRNLVHLVGPLFAGDVAPAERQAATTAWQRLSGELPSRAAAVELLEFDAERAYQGNVRDRIDVEDQSTVWDWDKAASQPVARRLPRSQAALVNAARLNHDLVRLDPSRPDYRRRAVISRLAVEQISLGMDAELSSLDVVPRDLLVGLDAVQLDAALAQALADGIEPAVYALVSLMDDPAVASTLLASPPDQTPPLVQSLSHPNPRIRWMAARTLAQLDPYGKFSGASRVVDNLTFAARTRGVSRAVVAHPNRSMGQRLAGMLASRGFQATTVTTSTDLLSAATASPDVELLLISNSMNEWTWWSLVEELRANPLTAGLPILVLARPDTVDKARVLADKQERLMLVSESLTEEDLQLQLPRILATAAEYRIDRERRFAMATDALKSLAGLLTDGRRLNVELLGDDAALLMGLDVPDLMEAATDVLVTLPEPVAQLALADTANQLARPITERQRAARGFAESVKRNGLLLSSAQVGQQYERYNQSRTLDPDTQQVLGTILDSIEQTE